ncbi:hypothetical protein BAY59_10650 [Prauserella coralliicola]|nr:hypothetical protein BAY59_10650 [Prauserella coralliicola]
MDGYDPDDRDRIIAPDPSITPELLRSYLEHAATVTRFTTAPHPHNRLGWVIRWGQQLDIRPVRLTPTDCDDRGTLTTSAVAAYLAKYATKATEQAVLGIGRTRVYDLIRLGLLQSVKVFGARRVPRDAVEPRNVNTMLERLLRQAKIDRSRVHDLRHTCATLLLLDGATIREVMDRLADDN